MKTYVMPWSFVFSVWLLSNMQRTWKLLDPDKFSWWQ